MLSTQRTHELYYTVIINTLSNAIGHFTGCNLSHLKTVCSLHCGRHLLTRTSLLHCAILFVIYPRETSRFVLLVATRHSNLLRFYTKVDSFGAAEQALFDGVSRETHLLLCRSAHKNTTVFYYDRRKRAMHADLFAAHAPPCKIYYGGMLFV